jgi:hypothetical protein
VQYLRAASSRGCVFSPSRYLGSFSETWPYAKKLA